MNKINITKEQSVLFNLVGHNLFSMPLNFDSVIDWGAVINESIAQSVSLLAFKDFRELPLDEKTAELLQKFLKKCAIANVSCFKGHEYVHNMMTKNGITYCIIKGAASSYYYPDPLLRNMGDVDFYVPSEHIDKARELFLAEGFECDENDNDHHYGFEKGNMRLELHFVPSLILGEEMRPIFLEYWSDLCDKASLVKDVFSEYVLPSAFHHGLILLTHFISHLTNVGIGLRHLCDWAVFANGFSEQEFVSLFQNELKRVGLWRLAQIISLAAVKHLGMPHKEWMGEDYATADALIEDVVLGGNFGRRQKGRSLELLFVSRFKSADSKKNRITHAFSYMNAIIRHNWKAAKRCPLLYPVGWVYFSMRFLVKRIVRGSHINIIKSYKQSEKRIELYNSLNLFEPEK